MKLFDVYSLFDIEITEGKDTKIYSSDGKEFLDLYGGHAVISIGHSHPEYVKAISEQVTKLGFYSNSVKNSLQEKLAEKLGKTCGYDDYELFLCNSGAEANENAVKLASFATGRKKVLAFKGAFHGRTSGAVALTDNPKSVYGKCVAGRGTDYAGERKEAVAGRGNLDQIYAKQEDYR